MSLAAQQHPSAAALKAYGQGRLSVPEMTAIEGHLADCDSCCDALAKLPDDTLLVRAREAATSGFRARENPPPAKRANPHEVPRALKDHPRYRVLGLLGAGGMGAVYKAEHRKMERMVALKVINPQIVSSAAALDRFEREVKTAAKLLHPNIVTAHDAEQAGDLHFLVMEFVEGVSLDRQVAKSGPLAPSMAAELIRQAAVGLQHAHEKGMIHRDIKPQNLMITRSSEGPVVKILDFGLAKLASQVWRSTSSDEAADRPDDATRAGAVLGTPDYIAPEQATDAHTADIRADIYSLGCTLYFLLTGEPPFAGGTLTEKLRAHQTCEPTPIRLRRPEVPEEMAAVLEKMLAKDPAQRYSRPLDVAQALEPFKSSRSPAKGGQPDMSQRPAATLPAPTVAADVDGTPIVDSAGLDVAIASVLPIVSAAPSKSLPSARSARGKSAEGVSPLLWAGAIGTAMLLAVTAFWYANQSGNSSDSGKGKSIAKQEDNKKSVTPNVPLNDNDPQQKASKGGNQKMSQSLPMVTPVFARTNRVLMVLPLAHTFFPDYVNVRNGLPSPYQIETAAWAKTPQGVGFASENIPPNGTSLIPDKELASVSADDYDALIFIGGQAGELCGNEPGAPTARKLIADFRAQKKLVGAICAGQHMLADHGLLSNPNTQIAHSEYAHKVPGFAGKRKAREVRRPIVYDEKAHLLTGAGANDGQAFARRLAEILQQQQ